MHIRTWLGEFAQSQNLLMRQEADGVAVIHPRFGKVMKLEEAIEIALVVPRLTSKVLLRDATSKDKIFQVFRIALHMAQTKAIDYAYLEDLIGVTRYTSLMGNGRMYQPHGFREVTMYSGDPEIQVVRPGGVRRRITLTGNEAQDYQNIYNS